MKEKIATTIFALLGAVALGVNYLPPDKKVIPAETIPVDLSTYDPQAAYSKRMSSIGINAAAISSESKKYIDPFFPYSGNLGSKMRLLLEKDARDNEFIMNEYLSNYFWIYAFNKEELSKGSSDSSDENILNNLSDIWNNRSSTDFSKNFGTVFFNGEQEEVISNRVLLDYSLSNGNHYFIVPAETEIIAPTRMYIENFKEPAVDIYPIKEASRGVNVIGRCLQTAADGKVYVYRLTIQSLDRWWYSLDKKPLRNVMSEQNSRYIYAPPSEEIPTVVTVDDGQVLGIAGVSSVPVDADSDSTRLMTSIGSGSMLNGATVDESAIIMVSVQRTHSLSQEEVYAFQKGPSTVRLDFSESSLKDFYSIVKN